MNVAIVILFWSLLGWRFAFAEFFGGALIIAVVSIGFTWIFGRQELERLRQAAVAEATVEAEAHFHHHEPAPAARGWSALARAGTWPGIARTALTDVKMLRTELIVGYLIAGFASALIPPGWLASALRAVGAIPVAGYLLLLALGLLIAVVTFVCSMGNVPIARYLANAGIPLGANTSFIYGDLLVPPLIAIYRKTFPPRVTWTFVALFAGGAMFAGAVMEYLLGNVFGGAPMASMSMNDRFTLVTNAVAIVAVAVVAVAAWLGSRRPALERQ